MHRTMSALGAALLFATGTGVAVAGGPNSFRACDGYGTPTGSLDGMTKEPKGFLLGLFVPLSPVGITRRSTPELGAAGIAACDKALADRRLADKYWQRRVSLLRARAVHALAVASDGEALADLARAEAAARPGDDPYYHRSLALGTRILRAYALRRLGRTDEAFKIAAEIQAERPYNRQISMALLTITGSAEASPSDLTIQSLARLEPRLLDSMFVDAFNRRDFEAAVALHPQLTPPIPTGDVGVSLSLQRLQALQAKAAAIYHAAERRGRLAYALAALGRAQAAVDQIAKAKAYLVAATPTPQPALPESKKDKRAGQESAVVAQAGAKAAGAVSAWARLVEWRLAIDKGDARRVLSEIESSGLPQSGVRTDLLLAANRKLLLSDGTGSDTTDASPPEDTGNRDQELRVLFASLPHAEIDARVPAYKKGDRDPMARLWSEVSGFKTKDDPGTGLTVIEYIGPKTSATVVEEMALLRAADLARERGRTGLVIRSRSDYERTTNTTRYGMTVQSAPSGYSTRLEVEFVDLEKLPELYRSTPWRAIDAADVISQLEPVYSEQKASQAAPGV